MSGGCPPGSRSGSDSPIGEAAEPLTALPSEAASELRLEVLVVDDSAVARQVFSTVLSKDPSLHTTVAADPIIAMEKMKRKRPDVILLDLEMPRMDGFTFLRQLMERDPIPVVVCSSAGGHGTHAALRALQEGAVEVVAKPKLGPRGFSGESALLLLDSVRAAAHAHPRIRRASLEKDFRARVSSAEGSNLLGIRASPTVIAVGASTGGTEAVRAILEVMPPDSPAFVIVQHMPEGFTRSFARQLDRVCRITVKEAADGDSVLPGQALVAPGNRHIRVRRRGEGHWVEVSDGPLVCRHRPSVDVLFHSIAEAAPTSAVGVILTGMGSDGADDMLAMRRAGAWTIAQDQASCVVYGMPKEAVARGGADVVVPLSNIAPAILQRTRGHAGLKSSVPPRAGGYGPGRPPRK